MGIRDRVPAAECDDNAQATGPLPLTATTKLGHAVNLADSEEKEEDWPVVSTRRPQCPAADPGLQLQVTREHQDVMNDEIADDDRDRANALLPHVRQINEAFSP